tara:strand:- start:28 stop:1956 length:1929 start_codon:yes stop_codon:yes gene_type:complete
MRKKIKRNTIGQFAKNTSEVSFVNLSTYTSPEIIEVKSRDWVEYGADNNYFQFLIDRYNGSPTNNAAINGISQAIYGKGLNATDANKKPDQYAQMVSMFKKDVVRKLCYDLKLMGQCAVQVVYSKDRSKISLLEHLPIETLRAEKANEEGEIPAYYYFKDWQNIKPSNIPLRIPAYGMSKENIEIMYIKPYKAGFYYYSPVDYQGGLQYAELEEEISNYHLNNILNGLSPSMLISFNNGVPNQEERRLIESKIAQKFSGTSNAGKFILSFNDNKEQESTITPVQLSDAHQQYQFLSDESSKKIMVAHRIVSPMLLGIKDSTGLGNNAEEIKTASLLMDNTVIRPFQELLIDYFDVLLSYNDIALNLYFTTLQPLEFTEVDPTLQDDEDIEEETGVVQDELTSKNIDSKLLSKEDTKNVLGSLKDSGIKLNDNYEFVAEMDENDEVTNEEFANYLIEEKKSTLSKIKKLVGLKDATEKNVGSVRDGSAFSYLDSKNGLYKIRYKYARGMKSTGKSRDFCREMMQLSESGLVWRIEDIDNASYGKLEKGKRQNAETNVEFRHRPDLPYDIFTLKGGIYCQHKWVRLLYRLRKRTKVKSENLNDYMIARNKNEIPKYMINKKPKGTEKSKIPTDKQLPNRGAYPK